MSSPPPKSPEPSPPPLKKQKPTTNRSDSPDVFTQQDFLALPEVAEAFGVGNEGVMEGVSILKRIRMANARGS
ncbi:hypothetical protein TWF481_012140 [Arthrobotrys musiformis]|uniref:Uncharacterized protein n=1 Tax=Arthrobotrys musiformis TaxID=47236 RepID=A0AAV9VXQ0_9PEZI